MIKKFTIGAASAAALIALATPAAAAPKKCGPVDAAMELKRVNGSQEWADLQQKARDHKPAPDHSRSNSTRKRFGGLGLSKKKKSKSRAGVDVIRTPANNYSVKEFAALFPKGAEMMKAKQYTKACRHYEMMGRELKMR